MTTPGERMLELLSLLQSGRRWTSQDLSRAMDVPARTLRRDLEHLRDLGYRRRCTRSRRPLSPCRRIRVATAHARRRRSHGDRSRATSCRHRRYRGRFHRRGR
ncbi:MAG TPA: HTH domain-containing protein [Candidatus Nocardiopsis merdipullorum]|nr:HTH domain-containing protein [Candidatus Nocardiopsis merdipullorum]